jgi:inner membrane transporter RhtA
MSSLTPALRARMHSLTAKPRSISLRAAAASVPPPILPLIGMATVQFGAALGKSLFTTLDPGSVVFLRVGSAAIILLLFWRPRLHGYSRGQYATAALFGLVLATMNLAFYESIARLPLGIAVALEFTGPLGVAVAGSRRLVDVAWVILAAAGIILLAPWTGSRLDPLGIVFALVAGALWAAYILLSARTGQAFSGATGLVLSMTVAAVVLVPVGVANGGSRLRDPHILLLGVVIGILSSVIPYSLELEALRRLPTRVFGILMSMEPAIAALVGFLTLREALDARALTAIALVTVASLGATRSQKNIEP